MKTIDELKGPRPNKKPKSGKTTTSTRTTRKYTGRTGVPTMPKNGHEDAYELDSLFDTFNL